MKQKFTKKQKQFKTLLKPIFCSTIRFGYATEKEVDRMLNKMLKTMVNNTNEAS